MLAKVYSNVLFITYLLHISSKTVGRRVYLVGYLHTVDMVKNSTQKASSVLKIMSINQQNVQKSGYLGI